MSFLSRFEPLLGSENLKKIEDARIAVFGLGGVGSYTAEALASFMPFILPLEKLRPKLQWSVLPI